MLFLSNYSSNGTAVTPYSYFQGPAPLISQKADIHSDFKTKTNTEFMFQVIALYYRQMSTGWKKTVLSAAAKLISTY